MSTPICIASFPKNAREEARVCLSEYAGHKLIDCRVYAPFAGPAKEMAPTGKGISLAVDKIPDLIAALQRAQLEAEALGWIGGA